MADGDVTTQDDLRKMLDTERSARAVAERERDEARGKHVDEIDARFKAEEDAADARAAEASAEADRLESEYATLLSEGKFAEAAKAQRDLAKAVSTAERYTDRKAEIGSYKEKVKQQRDTQPKDPMTPATRRWINEHPQFNSDPKYHAKAMAAHYTAVEEGLTMDSPEYFTFINAKVEGRPVARQEADDEDDEPEVIVEEPEEEEQEPEVIVTRAKTTAKSSAAPVSRTVPGNARANAGGTITLTADQREAADMTLPDLAPADRYRTYAKNMQALKSQGRI